MSSFWDKMGDKEINESSGTKGGLYFEPGNYLARINRCRMIETREKHDAFVAEFEVLESDNEDRPVGCKPALFVDMDGKFPELALGNVTDFVRAGLACCAAQNGEEHPPIESIGLDKETMKAVTGEDNILAGTFIQIYAFNKPTREGRDFTRFDWSVPANIRELAASAA